MQEKYDVCIIGGGILGCMAARELSFYKLRVLLVEKKEDVCCGMTKANMAILYAGYDHKPGTRKGSMCLRGNQNLRKLCEELEVPVGNCGSLMVGFGPESEKVLRQKLEQGRVKEIPGLKLLSGEEVLAMEPGLNPSVTMGLYAPTTATVNPWELGIAVWENARENGLETSLHTEVQDIKYRENSFEIELKEQHTGKRREIEARGIINCAGIEADRIREMLLPPKVRIRPERASFLVFSFSCPQKPEHILFYEPEEERKGLTLVPTTDGSLLVGATEETARNREDLGTTEEGLKRLRDDFRFLFPESGDETLLRSFAGLRPRPYDSTNKNKSISGFVIDEAEECPGLISLIGVKTPGLTCSEELAKTAINLLFKGWQQQPEKKEKIQRNRKTIKITCQDQKDSQRILCHCNHVTEAEILEAVRRGATTLEAIEHRTHAGLGFCQGSRCRDKISRMIGVSL